MFNYIFFVCFCPRNDLVVGTNYNKSRELREKKGINKLAESSVSIYQRPINLLLSPGIDKLFIVYIPLA